MTPAQDRRHIAALIDEATADGARLPAACAALGLSLRTLQPWRDPAGGIREDHRPSADRQTPANKLSEEDRDRIVATCNAPEFASLPPSKSPLQAMKDWDKLKPQLFRKQPYYEPGCYN